MKNAHVKTTLYCFLFLCLVTPGFLVPVNAQPTTYYQHIAPIIYDNCTRCHRIGQIGPFPFTNYNEVAAYAHSINHAVAIGEMPPWPPDPSYSQFLDQRMLSVNEKQTISDWVAGGLPPGNPANEPAIPNFEMNENLGPPDLEITMLDSFVHLGDNTDRYMVFAVPSGITQQKVLRGIEFVPGNNRIVHHAVISSDTTARALYYDSLYTVEYGYPSFGGVGFSVSGQGIQRWAPGQRARLFPENMGKILEANSYILFHIHYGPYHITESDRSSVRFYFYQEEEPDFRPIKAKTIRGPHLLNPPLEIAANEIKTFEAELPITKDITILSVYPHMHFLGKSWEVHAVNTEGFIKPLIKIDDWDFHWQLQYDFRVPVVLPEGSIIFATAVYDNTWGNVDNPNFPPQDVAAGYHSTDEMFWFSISFVSYRDGDEDLNFTAPDDVSAYVPENTTFFLDPNPFRDDAIVNFYVPEELTVSFQVFDLSGKLVKSPINSEILQAGVHQVYLFENDYSEGLYILRLKTGAETKLLKVVKTN